METESGREGEGGRNFELYFQDMEIKIQANLIMFIHVLFFIIWRFRGWHKITIHNYNSSSLSQHFNHLSNFVNEGGEGPIRSTRGPLPCDILLPSLPSLSLPSPK